MFECLGRVDHVEHQMQICGMDEILLHPDQGYQVILSQQNTKYHTLCFPCISSQRKIEKNVNQQQNVQTL